MTAKTQTTLLRANERKSGHVVVTAPLQQSLRISSTECTEKKGKMEKNLLSGTRGRELHTHTYTHIHVRASICTLYLFYSNTHNDKMYSGE